MPKQRRLLIMISPKTTPILAATAPPQPPVDDSDSSDASSTMSMLDLNDPSENLEALLTTLKEQLTGLAAETRSVRYQVKGLFYRAKAETTDWWSESLAPSSPELRIWLKRHDCAPEPTLEEFIQTLFAAAKSLDLESRLLTFSKGDAAILFEGRTQITIWEVLAALPRLFQ